jgi:predicted nucleic acid-binding protein
MNSYFVDTCIYLHVWKKEEPYWQSALRFFEQVQSQNSTFYYSGFVLKELEHILGKELFVQKRAVFTSSKFKKIFVGKQDLDYARFIEEELEFTLSFFDCIHLASAYKLNATLVSNDNLLIGAARRLGIKTLSPHKEFIL